MTGERGAGDCFFGINIINFLMRNDIKVEQRRQKEDASEFEWEYRLSRYVLLSARSGNRAEASRTSTSGF